MIDRVPHWNRAGAPATASGALTDPLIRSGQSLYGDTLEGDALAQWYRDEEAGYFELSGGRGAQVDNGANQWSILNQFHLRGVLEGPLAVALAFGTADGSDIAPWSDRIGEFIAVEPARRWWSHELAGRPARFIAPRADGILDVDDGAVDAIFCFGVLHHVARVSTTIRECHRVLKPGGKMVVREPISSMGDWSKPRPGLTRHERGIDPAWMKARAEEAGLRLESLRLADFSPLQMVLDRIGIGPRRGPLMVRVDQLLCALTRSNHRYVRDRWWHKLAPGAAYYVFARPAAASARTDSMIASSRL